MTRALRTHLLPELFSPATLADGVAVVIDILRASTTMTAALSAGATRVIPCGEVKDAHEQAAQLAGDVILGGERGGKRIAGFELGNSPAEYRAETVRAKTVVFTTTNGTRALLRAQFARRVLVGSFWNLHALLELLARETGTVHLVCAGTDGEITLEDVLFAGAVATGLGHAVEVDTGSDDATQLALSGFAAHTRSAGDFLAALRGSRGGRNLCTLGMEGDIELAAMWDTVNVVPELSPSPWELRPTFPAAWRPQRWLDPPAVQ